MKPPSVMDVARAAQLEPGRVSGDEHYFRCPRHEDKDPSLRVNPAKKGFSCKPCNVEGNYWKFAAFLAGLSHDDKPAVTTWLRNHGLLDGDRTMEPRGQIVATYDYRTAEGELAYQVVRFEPKDFRQRRPDGNGAWIWDTKGLKRLPYNLVELLKAEYVWIPEGEKDVESLRKIGLVGTCNSGGAGKWTAELAQYFNPGQHVTILPDNDGPGGKHAHQVAASLHGKVASIRVLELAGLAEKGDVSDWLMGRDPEAAAEELSWLSDGAQEWKPTEQTGEAAAAGFTPPAHWELLDVADVENWTCPELEWIVEHIVAKGNLVFVAADTQCGKSLLALYLSLKILIGGTLFGKFQIKPVKRVLYLLLEDPSRRAKKRILDLRKDLRVKPEQFMVYVAPGFAVNDDAHFAWLREFIRQGGYDFVILDTYQKATPGISSFDDVKQGPILHKLANLTRELNLTLWIHDHYRKDNGQKRRRELDLSSLKGTGGKPQNADCYILMERTDNTIKVLVSSKDTDKKPRFLLNVSREGSTEEKFTYGGDLSEGNDMAAIGLANQEKVLNACSDWSSCKDVVGRTSLTDSTVGKHLRNLRKAGKIEQLGKGPSTQYRKSTETIDRGEQAPCEVTQKRLI